MRHHVSKNKVDHTQETTPAADLRPFTCTHNTYIHTKTYTTHMHEQLYTLKSIHYTHTHNTKHMNHICTCVWSIVCTYIHIHVCAHFVYIYIYVPSAKIPLLTHSYIKLSTRLDCKDFLLEFSIYIQKQGLFCHVVV